MSQPAREEPFSESNLDCPEYRERLMRKLNCLIALLEVAMARVHRTLAGPDPDVDRLRRIQENLRSTLDVCRRARGALERRERLPDELRSSLARVAELRPREGERERGPGEPALDAGDDRELPPARRRLPRGARVELRGEEEARKFERLGPITPRELAGADLDALSRWLQG